MKSQEFFNILDDIDDRIVSEIYEDVQRPQKLVAVHRSPKKLPKILLGSAACLAVIAAAGLAVKFAAPGGFTALSGTSEAPGSLSAELDTAVSLSQTSDTVSMNDSGSVTSESLPDWLAQSHINPLKRTGLPATDDKTYLLNLEHGVFLDSDVDWSPEDYELIAVDNGTVVFSGKISDAYGSGVIIKYAENAYVAYGGLDPDTVTVSTGDTVTTGKILAHPKAFSCMDAYFIAYINVSRQPVTEEIFRSECDTWCQVMNEVKNRINIEEHGQPDPDGNHRITANTGDEVRAIDDGVIIYTGTDSDGSGTVVTFDSSSGIAFVVYKGLDTTFPDYYVQKDLKMATAGDTIGYVGGSGDAYWFVLDNLEFEKFAEENGIDFYPTHITFKNTIVHKP